MSWWGEKRDAAAQGGHPAPLTWAPGPGRKLAAIVVGFMLLSLFLLAPSAFADSPPNDKFEDAEVLGPALPVLVPGSNVDATEESSGEPYDVFAAGHSVWFSWTAPGDEVVTVDTCNSEFATRLTVFTGTSLGALAVVGEDSNSDGRYCPDVEGVTFRAVSGTTYSILIDGDAFSFPESPPPVTQGSFELSIRPAPVPTNNDFAQAAEVGPSVSTESGGAFSYESWGSGFNWNASKEAGEPNHAGDPGGASVWYRWTAPRTGHAEIGACSSFDVLLGLYTGDFVNALTPVAAESKPAPCFVNFTAVAGTTYRIAVDGKLDTGSGVPTMTSFGIHVSMNLPAPAPKVQTAGLHVPSDVTPPETKIAKRVLKRQPPIWIFRFSSNEPGSTFQCKLDRGSFARCGSSQTFRHPQPGRHKLQVRAVDASGNVDPSPAVGVFHGRAKGHPKR